MNKDTVETITWSAPEYEYKERSRDWFWALGIIVFMAAAAAAIFGNYFFALLILISGALFAFIAIKVPDMVTFELSSKGLKISDRMYLFENIQAFWVDAKRPALFIKSQRVFVPIIFVPLDSELAERVHLMFLSKNVTEEEMQEHPAERIMDSLGF